MGQWQLRITRSFKLPTAAAYHSPTEYAVDDSFRVFHVTASCDAGYKYSADLDG
jgi:hypothetical protein